MQSIFLCYTILSIGASMIALYIIIIATFEKNENGENSGQAYIKRDARKIKVNTDYQKNNPKTDGLNTQGSSLIWTVLIGQFIGLYFLYYFITTEHIIRSILRYNSLILLLASFLCTLLTILNGFYKKRMELSNRLIFLFYSFIISSVLIYLMLQRGIDVKVAVINAGKIPYLIIVFYFVMMILALISMLLDGTVRKYDRVDFNFNIYYYVVIGVSFGIGLSMWMMLEFVKGT
ncbi:hypothetical protein GF337_03790 [candidate division KSB1 bacterium]|nr:hypothetical protein [candidate division KSB1 bacterium]